MDYASIDGENSRKGKAHTNGTTQLESMLHHLYGIAKSTGDRKELNPCGSREWELAALRALVPSCPGRTRGH